MSIQSTPFPLVIDSDDFQRTDRGQKWAVKFHEIPNFGQMVYAVRVVGSSTFPDVLDDSFDMRINRDYGGDVKRWLKEFLIPKLNTWLMKTFPAGAGPVTPPELPVFSQAFEAAKAIKITVNADGTLTASV